MRCITGKNHGKQGILWKKFPAGKNQGIWKKWVKSGKNQGILQKHVREISGNFQLYIYTDSFPIFQDIYIYILENGETIRGKSGKNQGICFTKLSGHPDLGKFES